MLRSSKCFVCLMFPYLNPACISPVGATCPSHLILGMITWITLGKEYNSWRSSLCCLLQFSDVSTPLIDEHSLPFFLPQCIKQSKLYSYTFKSLHFWIANWKLTQNKRWILPSFLHLSKWTFSVLQCPIIYHNVVQFVIQNYRGAYTRIQQMAKHYLALF
jgi:hypothetical protein